MIKLAYIDLAQIGQKFCHTFFFFVFPWVVCHRITPCDSADKHPDKQPQKKKKKEHSRVLFVEDKRYAGQFDYDDELPARGQPT